MKDTLLLVPTYNELSNVAVLLTKIGKCTKRVEILLVDDNSTDGTAQIVRQHYGNDSNVKVIVRYENPGYGQSIMDGFRWAVEHGYETVVTMDADLSHDPKEIPDMIKQLEQYDICIGSRYVNGIRVLNWSPQRLLLSLFANAYVRKILGLPFADNTSGFRAYRIDVIKKLLEHKISCRGYSFLVALLWHAVNEGFTVCEHPITFHERRQGQSKMSKSIILEAVFTPFLLLLSFVWQRTKKHTYSFFLYFLPVASKL